MPMLRPVLLSLALAVVMVGCTRGCGNGSKEAAAPVDAGKRSFHVGERWNYRARPGEETSTLTVLKIESLPKSGVVVHVSVDGLHLKSPKAPTGMTDNIGHLPFAEAALDRSVTTLAAVSVALPDYEAGYDEWRRAKGGVFTITVAEAVAFVEDALNR